MSFPAPRETWEPRFLKYVAKSDGCWEWTGNLSSTGYGTFTVGGRAGKTYLTHRLSFEMHAGPIPDGLFVCHHCDNRKCVRPDHLFLGTPSDNTRDAVAKKRVIPPFEHRRAVTLEQRAALRLEHVRHGGTLTTRQLAERHGVTTSAVLLWVA